MNAKVENRIGISISLAQKRMPVYHGPIQDDMVGAVAVSGRRTREDLVR